MELHFERLSEAKNPKQGASVISPRQTRRCAHRIRHTARSL